MAAFGKMHVTSLFLFRFPVNVWSRTKFLHKIKTCSNPVVFFNGMNEVVKWQELPIRLQQVQQSTYYLQDFRFSLSTRLLTRISRFTQKPTFWLEKWRNLPSVLVSCLFVTPSLCRRSTGPIYRLPRQQFNSSYLPVASLSSSVVSHFNSSIRHASNFTPRDSSSDGNDGQDSKPPPTLMNLPPIIWPSLFLSIKNWFLTKVIIQPYLDSDFNLTDFMKGAKQALVFVSYHLAQGNFDALDGVVAYNALQEIKRNHALLNLKQRQELQINPEEVYFSAPYQIGIIMEDNSNQRFAEITIIYHCLRGIEELRQKDPPLNEMAKYTDYITICNYRFIREYTKGVQSEWMINALNHFKLKNVT